MEPAHRFRKISYSDGNPIGFAEKVNSVSIRVKKGRTDSLKISMFGTGK
jgi:hypothetical protein